MKNRMRWFLVLTGTILLGIGRGELLAQTVAVGTCMSGATVFTTIQEAVNAAAPGSTVTICPGNYPEQVTITKALTLTGVEDNGRAPQ